MRDIVQPKGWKSVPYPPILYNIINFVHNLINQKNISIFVLCKIFFCKQKNNFLTQWYCNLSMFQSGHQIEEKKLWTTKCTSKFQQCHVAYFSVYSIISNLWDYIPIPALTNKLSCSLPSTSATKTRWAIQVKLDLWNQKYVFKKETNFQHALI